MSKPRIVLSESLGFSDGAAERLREAGELVLGDLDRDGLLAAAADADVLWVRLRHRIDAELMAAAPRLKILATATTGLDHIDLEEAERRGIRVVSLRGEAGFLRDVRATAEHTIGLILSLLRRTPAAAADVEAGAWDRDRFRGFELHEKTVGVVGYGRLGRIVARYLGAFDARVLVSDPTADPGSLEPGLALVPLPRLLGESALVTLHVNLTEGSRGFFGSQQIQAMREGAWLVNTARGELVDEEALLDALRSGRLAGAALDVISGERGETSSHPLVAYAREHDNLIITPHIGGSTYESMEKTERFVAERVVDLLTTG